MILPPSSNPSDPVCAVRARVAALLFRVPKEIATIPLPAVLVKVPSPAVVKLPVRFSLPPFLASSRPVLLQPLPFTSMSAPDV
jgi:hypothetical protein